MSAYVLAQLQFINIESYRRYQDRFIELFADSGARLLCADESPTLLEGDWMGDKVVLMEFSDEECALQWLRSPAYQAISEDRKAGANTTALLLKGLA